MFFFHYEQVLLLISANSDSVRTQLIRSLNEISGETVKPL